MPQAVKLPDALIQDARTAAERESRSLAGQIEHWARLGRTVEASLASPELAALQGTDDGEALARTLKTGFTSGAKAALAEDLRGRVSYGTDPAFPGYLVRFEPGGVRTPGRLVNRQFVELASGNPAIRAPR